ncbi:fibroblast growth factor receptor 3-like [Phlebotomus argentipes]|uniref:fibroblast growth factor receptor 3-like n=1 Tax=Phlebotomus argentipes TaxID=94469 RepID=UPI0028932BF1|nr:fibroblast growth factor receptor 3-like [Phlebotomus argentipes]
MSKFSVKSVVKLELALFFLVDAMSRVAGIDHCSSHLFAGNSTNTQFTKEVVNHEYAVLNQFKSLHCCAKGYRSIEWFKDGRPYPWSGDVSTLILYPEASNQTIYTRHASFVDNGNYTCVVSNETMKLEQHMSLVVQANSPDAPLPTYRPKDQTVPLGHTARFYCEAFVGNLGLPDVNSDISWYRVYEREQVPVSEDQQKVIRREDDQNIGAILELSNVDVKSYGRYMCRIEMGNAAHRFEMSAWLFGPPVKADESSGALLQFLAIVLACMAFVVLLTVYRYAPKWRQASRKKSNQSRMDSAEKFNIPTRP